MKTQNLILIFCSFLLYEVCNLICFFWFVYSKFMPFFICHTYMLYVIEHQNKWLNRWTTLYFKTGQKELFTKKLENMFFFFFFVLLLIFRSNLSRGRETYIWSKFLFFCIFSLILSVEELFLSNFFPKIQNSTF